MPPGTVVPFVIEIVTILFVLLRFGFLVSAVLNVVEATMLITPSIWPPQQWHTSLTVLAGAFIALLAGYGFVTSLGGRPLFTGELMEA